LASAWLHEYVEFVYICHGSICATTIKIGGKKMKEEKTFEPN
jgi:hypothetical protein